MKRIRLIFLFFVCGACLDEPDCLVTATNLVKIDFIGVDGKTVEVNLTRITASGSSSTLYANTKTSSVALPLNPNAKATTFTIVHENITDVLTITYDKSIRIISTRCGANTYYSNASVSESTAEVVKVKSGNLSTTITTNFEVLL